MHPQPSNDISISFYVACLDDILKCSKTLEDHIQHVRQVLDPLQQASSQVKPLEYEFHKTTTQYLRRLVMRECLKMDPGKVSVVEQWPIPQQLHNVYTFIRFSNFYQPFSERFSQAVHLLTALTKKDTPFI
jgi:hypothetical protein